MKKWLIVIFLFFIANLLTALSIQGNTDKLVLKNSLGYADFWITNNLNDNSLLTINTNTPTDLSITITPSNFELQPGQTKYFTVKVDTVQQASFKNLKIKATNCISSGICEQAERNLDVLIMQGSKTVSAPSSEKGNLQPYGFEKTSLTFTQGESNWDENGYFVSSVTVKNEGNDNTFKFYLVDSDFKFLIAEKVLQTNEQSQITIRYKPFSNNVWIITDGNNKFKLEVGTLKTQITNQKNNIPITTINTTKLQDQTEPTTTGLFLGGLFDNPVYTLIGIGLIFGAVLLVLNLITIKKITSA